MLTARNRNRKGFTAVEIAMVATVIAILALLILPVFRQRSEDARRAAAEDELQSLAKAMLLIEADLPGGNFLVRLNDLDNRDYRDQNLTTPGTNPALEPPAVFWVYDAINGGRFAVYNDPTSPRPVSYATIAANWIGPYAAMKKTAFLGEIDPVFLSTNGGPIYVFPGDAGDDRYPLDPWGSPYILFGPEETSYNVRAIYSLGVDRVPGISGITPVNQRQWREQLESGANAGADLYYYF